MNIVIAPDSYKGSLSSVHVAETMKKAILSVHIQANVILKPMADGGEGTLDALVKTMNFKKVNVTCTGPLGYPIHTSYAIKNQTALIESAIVSGLTQVPIKKRNPDMTTSYGIGEIIIDALNRGCSSFIIGLGGSATNDGGFGMLKALGMEAWDESGKRIDIYGRDVKHVNKISFKRMDPRLKYTTIKIASDVNNPLCGKNGASFVYGPQKGMTHTQTSVYDSALLTFGHKLEKVTHTSNINTPGAGAAGGIAHALLSLNASLLSGAELIAHDIQLEDAIKHADIVLTGEGKSDEQTLYGKAPFFVAQLAKKYNVPAVLISGSLTGDLTQLRELFAGCFSIHTGPTSLKESMDHAEQLLYEKTKLIIHFLVSLSEK